MIGPESPRRPAEGPLQAAAGGASVGHPVNVATGAVFASYEDIHIPGRLPIRWERRYSTDLLDPAPPRLPFGPGWYSPWYATLTRVGQEYRFRTPEGTLILLPDPDAIVERGGTVRNLGTFAEISKQGLHLHVTRWDPVSFALKRFIFLPGRNGQEWPMRFLEDGEGDGVELAWDDQGRLKGLRQKLEKRTLVATVNAAGAIAAVSFRHPEGRLETLARYEYDSRGRLAAAFDALGHADRYEYDGTGRLTREIAKDGGVFSFRYDDKGRCIRTGGLDGYDTKIISYMDHVGMTKVADGYGSIRQFQWLPTGQVVLEIDPLGGRTRTEYDDAGRIAAVIGPLGGETRYAFDEAGNRISVKTPSGETRTDFDDRRRPVRQVNPGGAEFRRAYDAAGRLRVSIDPLGSEWSFAYDADGNLVKVDMAGVGMGWIYGPNGLLLESVNAEGRRTRFDHDPYGRIVLTVGPQGRTSQYRYDPLGRLVESIRPDGARIRRTYDAAGNEVRIQDGDGLASLREFGPCRRLSAMTDPLGRTTWISWGLEPGRLEAITNPKGETFRFHRDAAGRVIRTVDFAGVEKRYEYDPAGRLSAYRNGMGERIVCKRDASGRLTALVLPDESRLEFAYDASGFMVAAASPDRESAFERDILGRILKETRGDEWIAYGYSPQGRVSRTETSLGLALEYAYTPGNLLRALSADGETLIEIERDPLGAEKVRRLPGGLRLRQEVDPMGRLISQEVEDGAAGRSSLRREYAWNGMVMTGMREGGGETKYAYDPAEQLLRATRPGREELAYAYDPAGNLIAARKGAHSEDFELGTGNRLLRRGEAHFEYDRAGRLIRRSEPSRDPARPGERVWTYAWDALDQLREAITPEGAVWRYRYDALGRRISKAGPAGETVFVWDRDAVIQDRFGADPPRSWIMDVHTFRPFGRYRKGEFCPLVTDALGTPRELLDARGGVLWSAMHGPWGGIEEETGAENRCPLRFQGQWLDEETGLHYNRYRYYDPGAGRYLSPDPIGIRGGLNAYRYTPNPVNWIDPMGLDWNYVLVNDQGEVYYTGVASDNETACGVQRRHNNHEGWDEQPRFNPETDKMYQVTPKGTDHETARGLEQRIAADHDLVIGRKGSATNPEGSSRGNLQNPVDQSDSNAKRDSRAKAAQDHLDKEGKSTQDLIDDAKAKGELKCGG